MESSDQCERELLKGFGRCDVHVSSVIEEMWTCDRLWDVMSQLL